jgi:hypothetical protein
MPLSAAHIKERAGFTGGGGDNESSKPQSKRTRDHE